MPTYSYTCEACGQSFEKEQRISEEPLKKCELCGKPKARRQIVSGNFILKGGGWYSDGYGSSAKNSTVPSNGGASTTESAKKDSAAKTDSATKTDSKPDKPAASKAVAAE
jgi:putative FmdB family regulatory protein